MLKLRRATAREGAAKKNVAPSVGRPKLCTDAQERVRRRDPGGLFFTVEMEKTVDGDPKRSRRLDGRERLGRRRAKSTICPRRGPVLKTNGDFPPTASLVKGRIPTPASQRTKGPTVYRREDRADSLRVLRKRCRSWPQPFRVERTGS